MDREVHTYRTRRSCARQTLTNKMRATYAGATGAALIDQKEIG